MYLLKEHIDSLTFTSNYNETYESLLAQLNDIRLVIKGQDKKRGEIIVSCLIEAVNMGFWKCWIDRLLLEVQQVAENKTRVDIYGLPNLLKLRIKKDEASADVNKIISHLRQ